MQTDYLEVVEVYLFRKFIIPHLLDVNELAQL